MDNKNAGISEEEYNNQYETNGRSHFHWQSAISWKNRDRIVCRGYDVNELAERVSLVDMVFLIFQGRLPSENQEKMLNYQMIAFMEHAFSPSTVAARAVAVGRPTLTAAIAAGILTFGEAHGPGYYYAKTLCEYIERGEKEKLSSREIALLLVDEHTAQKRKILGLHQPQHTHGDPRAAQLVKKAKDLGVAGKFVSLQENIIEAYAERRGKRLHPNVLGAGGSVLLDLGFDPLSSWAVGVLTRGFSCAAHAIEEMTTQSAWRASSSSEMVDLLDLAIQGPRHYNGPNSRPVPSREERAQEKNAPAGEE